MGTFQQGKFRPNRPDKYIGDLEKIVFRSSWELKLFRFLDSSPNVMKWASEELIVSYVHPLDGNVHRYFPDIYAEVKKIDGSIEKLLIEVKPACQTKPPVQPKKRTRRFLNELATYAINTSKWQAATAFCKKNGWKFVIMTEHELGIK